MSEPEQRIQQTFHTTTHGGQQAIGSHHVTFHQQNTAAPAEEFARLLAVVKAHLGDFDDPSRAAQQVRVIEAAALERVADRRPVLTALTSLAALITAGATASTAITEAVDQARDLVVRVWPL
ncbi:hypothetical protein ACFY3U_21620 [Micromonospora sp. NPDC000089]|uniref:hypothetical protein n=1 Tax=unclassified Micromonospora TaxID=2617518 RepID=UPI003681B981